MSALLDEIQEQALRKLSQQLIKGSSSKNNLEPLTEKKNQKKRKMEHWLPRFTKLMANVLQLQLSTLAFGFIFMQKITQHGYQLTNESFCKFLVGTIIIAEKLHEDSYNSLQSFSLTSGFTKLELINIEIQILSILDYNFQVNNRQYAQIVHRITTKPFQKIQIQKI